MGSTCAPSFCGLKVSILVRTPPRALDNAERGRGRRADSWKVIRFPVVQMPLARGFSLVVASPHPLLIFLVYDASNE